MSGSPPQTCRGMAEAIAALKAMRDRYKAQGKMVQARTVEHCIQAIMRLG